MKLPISLLLLAVFTSTVSSTQDDSFPDHHLGNDTEKCYQFLHNLTKFNTAPINRSVEENNTLFYSGHNINDLGSYRVCNKLPTQSYNLFEVVSVGHLGFCGPSYCSTNDLQNYTDNFIKNMSKLFHKDLSPYRVKVIDPKISKIETGMLFYIAVLLIAGLGVLATIGTISANKPKVNSKPGSVIESSSVIEQSQEKQEGLREALLANTETVNEVFSKDTAKVYIEEKNQASITEHTQHQKPHRKTTFIKFAECFDLKKNLHDLMSFKVDPAHDQNLNVFNGVRAMAFGYVVIGHTFMSLAISKNYAYLQMFLKSDWVITLAGGSYAVDTFFYLSGFFTGFLLLSKLKKMPFGLSSYGQLIFHRFIRLWPAYLICILLYWKIAVHYGDGVMWYNYVSSAQGCSKDGWQNLLFINNMFVDSGNCFNWGWYLACDFQMFLLAPFVCWIYIKNKSKGMTVIWSLIFLSIVSAFYEGINTGSSSMFGPRMKADGDADNWGDDYVNTLVRVSPYLIGLLLGIKFREYKSGKKNFFTEIKNNKIKGNIIALIGLIILFYIVYKPRETQHGTKWSNGFAITWGVFTRPVYGIGVFMFTLPSLVGNLPSIRYFMSNVYFTIVSRLSYTAYLIHFVILLMIAHDTDQVIGFNEWADARIAFAICMLSCFAAAMLHIFIEKPFVNIETKFFNKRQPAAPAAIKAKGEN